MHNDFVEDEDGENKGEISPLADAIMHLQKPLIEAAVYSARHQGLKAGVGPSNYVRQPGEEELFVPKRIIFINYPEKTVSWGFKETEENLSWLDGFPQYDQ